MAERIQRKRTPGWRRGTAVIVDRTSRYGNPFRILNGLIVEDPETGRVWTCGSPERARKWATELYRAWVNGDGPDTYTVAGRTFDRRIVLTDLAGRLRGRDLACPCPLPEPGHPDWCHATVQLELANAQSRLAGQGP